MNLGLVLYLISLLDNFAIIMLVAFAIITIFICLYSLEDLTWLKKMKTWKRVIILLSLGVSVLTYILIPSKEDMYKILIGYQIGTVSDGIDKTKTTVDYIIDKINESEK